MGNCIRHESPMQWGGDDWGSTAGDEDEEEEEEEEEMADDKDGLLGERVRSGQPEGESMVKVRITKRQLEELLGKVDVKELSAHQAVAQLLVTAAAAGSHQRAWRPALQSIPEAN